MTRMCSVIAMDVITSLGEGLAATWQRVRTSASGIGPIHRFRAQQYATGFAAELPQAMIESAQAQAGTGGLAYRLASLVGERAAASIGPFGGACGLILATTKAEMTRFEQAVRSQEPDNERLFEPLTLAHRVRAQLGLRGPVQAVSSACASGLLGLIQGARLLERGDAARVLVIGVDTLSDFVLRGFSALKALSSRPCRPFDVNRDGLTLGEGAGAMVLGHASEPDAIGWLRGWGMANDATHVTGPSRSGEGLALAIDRAMVRAGCAPGEVGMINAHGTGTVYNDAMEAKALDRAFPDAMPPVFSLKGQLGHTLGAAGVIETGLTFAAMADGLVPPTVGLDKVGVAPPLPASGKPRPLAGPCRLAMTQKSGFGGINAAVILESAIHGRRS